MNNETNLNNTNSVTSNPVGGVGPQMPNTPVMQQVPVQPQPVQPSVQPVSEVTPTAVNPTVSPVTPVAPVAPQPIEIPQPVTPVIPEIPAQPQPVEPEVQQTTYNTQIPTGLPDTGVTSLGSVAPPSDNTYTASSVVSEQSSQPVVNNGIGTEVLPNNENVQLEPPAPVPDKPKNKNNLAFIFLVIVAIAAVAGGVWYFFFRKEAGTNLTPRQVFVNNLTSMKNSFVNTSESTTSSGKFNILFEPGTTDIGLGKLDLTIDYESDMSKNIMKADLTSNYKDGKLLNGSVYLVNNELYLYSSELYDKYIKLDSDELNLESLFKKEYDAQKFLGGLIDSFVATLDDSYFTKTQEGNLVLNTFTLNDNNAEKFFDTLSDKLINNTDFINEYAKINGLSVADAKEDLKDSLSVSGEYEESCDITITIYTDVNNKMTKLVYKMVETDDTETKNEEMVFDNVTNNGFNYTINVENLNVTGSVLLSNTDGETVFKITVVVPEVGNFTISGNYAANKEVTAPTIGSVVNIDELTEFETSFIGIRIMSNPGFSSLMSDLENFNLFSSGYDDSESDDSDDMFMY